jgi:hypothetical protein
MGAHDGGLFDRTVIDVGETSAGSIAVQQVKEEKYVTSYHFSNKIT